MFAGCGLGTGRQYRRDLSKKKTEAPAGLPADLLIFFGKKTKGGEVFKKPDRLLSSIRNRGQLY